MTARPVQSLRVRLVLGLSLTICLVWSGVAIWQFTNMQRELRTMLDERLIASARMVAGIVVQFQPTQLATAPRAQNDALLSVIARDGVACEVSLVRSEVDFLPIARTNNIPDMASAGSAGFGQITKGGKQWRTYVLEENGVRVATADRLDVRDQLVQTFVRTLVLPFVLALAVILLLTCWMGTRSLRPLQRLREELVQRPPHDPTPVQSGRDVKELAPLVDSLNQLLARMDASMEHERRWTADAAHELRTPLTAIKTHVQVAQLTLAAGNNNASPDKAANALRQAGEGIDHMHATLEQLLQLARVESASAGETRATVGTGIAQAFRLACSQSLQRAENEGIQLPSPPLDAAEIPADPAAWQAIQLPLPPALLACATTNLIDNALRHHQGPAPVSATLRWQADDAGPGTVEVCVRDEGPGLTPAECEQALRRFWRKSSSSPGSGLGLTIVRRIAESAHGTLTLEPAEPGLRARLCLPALAVTSSAAKD